MSRTRLAIVLAACPSSLLVTVVGDVDLANHLILESVTHEAIEAAIDNHQRVELDLSGVTFRDSTGLRSLLQESDHARRAGIELQIVAAARQLRILADCLGVGGAIPGLDASP